MLISLAAGLEAETRPVRSRRAVGDLEEVLELAKQLRDRACAPIEGEQRHGVRVRLMRAHVLSIVDLLTEMTVDSESVR